MHLSQKHSIPICIVRATSLSKDHLPSSPVLMFFSNKKLNDSLSYLTPCSLLGFRSA